MDEIRKIGCSTKVGKAGKLDKTSELTVSHANLGAVITLVRHVGFADPLAIMLSLDEATELMADLARAVETEVRSRQKGGED